MATTSRTATAEPSARPLQITDAAVDALGRTIDDEPLTDPVDREQAREVLAAVAPYLVAAELRRLAEELNSTYAQPEMNAGLGLALRKIRARAVGLEADAR